MCPQSDNLLTNANTGDKCRLLADPFNFDWRELHGGTVDNPDTCLTTVVQDGAYRNSDLRLPVRVQDFNRHRRTERGRGGGAIENIARLVSTGLRIGGIGNLSQAGLSAETVAS